MPWSERSRPLHPQDRRGDIRRREGKVEGSKAPYHLRQLQLPGLINDVMLALS